MKKIVLVLSMMMPMALAMTAQQEMKVQHMPDGKGRIEHMSKELNLTPAQREKVEKIYRDEMKQMQKMGEKMKKERENTDKKVMKVLSPEQQAKYGKMLEMRGKHRMGFGNGPRHDGKRPHHNFKGHRPDGKMGQHDGKGPRHHGKKGPRPGGKQGQLHEDGQLLSPPQNENGVDPVNQ
jgi:Spy/CpxP family protein refolding chaperone